MIKTICKDCVEVMQQIPDNYFDLCLTDPPYNAGKDYGPLVNDKMEYEEYKAWCIKWFKEVRRVSKGVLFSPGTTHLQMWLTEIEYPKWIVCWYKSNSNSQYANKIRGFIRWEPFLAYGDIRVTIDTFKVPVSILKNTSHPNPKPIKLMMELLKHTKKIKRVIDPFMGVGTTLVACKKLGIDCVGIDIEQSFIDEANIRLRNTAVFERIEQYLEW